MFVAVVPPEDAIEHLDEFLAPRRQHAGFRWSEPEQFHVTLAFLASVAERQLDELVEGLAVVALRRTTFGVRIRGGGAFPDPARARVLYAGLDLDLDPAAGGELDRLATGARAAASHAGVVVGGQRFHPHVTVARLARAVETTKWVRLLDTYAGPTWSADRLTLVASYLGEGARGRPRHETVAELPLDAPAEWA